MIKAISEMDEDTRVKCLINGWIAVDENCGTLTPESRPLRLWKSKGHRKAGRPTKYYLSGTGSIHTPVIEAYSDEEAILEANLRMDWN